MARDRSGGGSRIVKVLFGEHSTIDIVDASVTYRAGCEQCGWVDSARYSVGAAAKSAESHERACEGEKTQEGEEITSDPF